MKKVLLFTLLFGIIYNLFAQTYTLTDDDVVVEEGFIVSSSYNFEITNIIIPEILDGQTVIGIGNNGNFGSFAYKDITSIQLPKTIEKIINMAFKGNLIASLNFSECSSLKVIGKESFSSNKIVKLDFSDCSSLEIIDNRAFYNNSLPALNLAGCISLKTLDRESFQSNKITDVNFSDCISLETIANFAFYINEISNADLSSCLSLKSIGEKAFYNYTLTNIDVSECSNLMYIAENAFYPVENGFHLPQIIYNGKNYQLWKDGKNNNYTSGIDKATNFETYYNSYIPYTLTDEDVVIEEGIIQSCNYNFELKNIIIPEILNDQTVIGIRNYSPSGIGVFSMKGITSVQLPSSIVTIGTDAFYYNLISHVDFTNCRNLETIGYSSFKKNNIQSLDFTNCNSLKTISNSSFVGNNITSLDFSSCASLETINDFAFYYNDLNEVNITDCKTLNHIGGGAFLQNNLTQFQLPFSNISNYYYDAWKDNSNNSYAGGTYIEDLRVALSRVMPLITDIAPLYTSCSGNQNISIIGSNFETSRNDKSILFNGVEATSYTYWSDTLITVTSPPNPEGFMDIDLVLLNETKYTSPQKILYTENEIIPVCGELSGTWESGNTYFITCDCEIPTGEKLTIEPGVSVIAYHAAELTVNGEINAIGTESDSIIFKSQNGVINSWEGIYVINVGNFDFVSISNAKAGILNGEGTTSISNSTFSNNSIGLNFSSGYQYVNSEISNCNIFDNNIAINASASCKNDNGHSTVKIINSNIYNNKDGIILQARGKTGTGWVSGSSSSYVNLSVLNSNIYSNTNAAIKANADGFENDVSRFAHVNIDIENSIISNNMVGIDLYQREENSYAVLSIYNSNIINNLSSGITNIRGSINSYNSIYWDNNHNDIIETDSDSLYFVNNCIQYNQFGERNIEDDPKFISSATDNFHLQPTSPCIDAGSNEFVDFDKDFDDKVRIWDGNNDGTATIDIGAFEYDSPCNYSQIEVDICDGEDYQGETTSGIHRFNYQNISGCDSIVDVTLIVNELPDKPAITVNGETEFCEGGETTLAAPTGYPNYEWSNGQTEQEINVSESGNFSVKVTNDKGCSSEWSDAQVITVNSLPDKPFITVNGIELNSSSNAGNQWYLENSIINNAVNQTYQIEETGNYSVQVTSEKGCISEISDIVNVWMTSVNNIDYQLQVYPNPTTGLIKIEGLAQNEVTLVTIYDVLGQKLEQIELLKQNANIDLNSFKNGIYYLSFNNSFKSAIKIIKE